MSPIGEWADIETMSAEEINAELAELEISIEQMQDDNDTVLGLMLSEPSENLANYNSMFDRVIELNKSITP